MGCLGPTAWGPNMVWDHCLGPWDHRLSPSFRPWNTVWDHRLGPLDPPTMGRLGPSYGCLEQFGMTTVLGTVWDHGCLGAVWDAHLEPTIWNFEEPPLEPWATVWDHGCLGPAVGDG